MAGVVIVRIDAFGAFYEVRALNASLFYKRDKLHALRGLRVDVVRYRVILVISEINQLHTVIYFEKLCYLII